MLARVSTIQGKKEQIESGIKQYRDQTLPEISKMAGFKGAYLLVDRKSGKSVGITLWDSEDAMQASAAAGDKLRAQAAKTIEASTKPIVEMFEIAVQA